MLIAADPREGSVTFVSDLLGARPLFLAQSGAERAFFSDAWTAYAQGLVDAKLNVEAIATWAALGYNASEGCLFEGYARLPPASVTVVSATATRTTSYFTPMVEEPSILRDELPDLLHEAVSRSARAFFRDAERLTFTLSGGYDSRYLLALFMNDPTAPFEVYSVSYAEEEGLLAAEVAQRLGVKLTTLPVERSIREFWDERDGIWSIRADGFPITKNVVSAIASLCPGSQIVNGFLGGTLLRGARDTCLGKYEFEVDGDQLSCCYNHHSVLRASLIRPDLLGTIEALAKVCLARRLEEGARLQKAFFHTDVLTRQRFYIANNFLQHLDQCESVLPFMTPPLMALKYSLPYKALTRSTYSEVLRRYFPLLKDVPHSSDLRNRSARPVVPGWRRRAQTSRRLLGLLAARRGLSLFDGRRLAPRLAAAAVSPARSSILYEAERFETFEAFVAGCGIQFAWEDLRG